MANTFGYTPDEMRDTGTKLRGAQDSIGGTIDEVIAAVNGLIGSGFTTAVASGTYASKFEELSTGLRQVSENLGPLGDFLTGYADAVEQMDSELGAQLG